MFLVSLAYDVNRVIFVSSLYAMSARSLSHSVFMEPSSIRQQDTLHLSLTCFVSDSSIYIYDNQGHNYDLIYCIFFTLVSHFFSLFIPS